jgi:hypothetical protein
MFAGDKQMAPYRPRPDSTAFWFDTPTGDFMGIPPLSPDTWPDAAHEITHLIVGRTGASYPVWLNEGLALYYSTLAFTSDRVRIGGPPVRVFSTLGAGGFAIPLQQLFGPATDLAPGTDSRTAAILYAESWALTHMVFQHSAYRGKASAFLGAIAAGAPTPDAFQKIYGKTVVQVFSDVKKHLAKLQLPSSLVPAPAQDTRPTMRPAPRPPAAADAVDIERTLAEMLSWQHDTARIEQGRTALAALGARAPDNLKLLETRGLVSFHTGHCGDALDELRRAVDANTQNAAVLRAYAQLIGGADPERRQALLARATALAPLRPGPSLVIVPCGGDPARSGAGRAVDRQRPRRRPVLQAVAPWP